ncbi:hypothetical protein LguiA_006881 [Lonicera macranthoides]
MWSKLKAAFRLQGRYRRNKECRHSLGNKLNVEDEYKEATRTNSFIEICTKVEDLERPSSSSSSTTTSSNIPHHQKYVHISEYLLEPHQETLADMIKSYNPNPLLVDYFDATLEACNVCELLLQCVHKTRINYQILKGLRYHASDYDAIIKDLASFSLLNNQLSAISLTQFGALHDRHILLFSKLTLKCKKVKRRAKFINRCKKLVGCALIVSYGALAMALMMLIFHSVVGTLAAPGFIACSLGFFKKRDKLGRGVRRSISEFERIGGQLDVAARGIYILINDFDTMSRLVRRLNDEIEHIKAIADICVRNERGDEVLKEVVREIGIHENGFLEHLKELEEHIYLCFLTINRSRRLVLQEIDYVV